MEYDEKRKKQKLTEQKETVDKNIDEKNVDIRDLIGKKNASPQKSECDFGEAELFEFEQSLTAFNGENESNTEDEESSIKRRLFTRKRVIEKSDSNSGEFGQDELCDEKSKVGGKKLESVDETSESGVEAAVNNTGIKEVQGVPQKSSRTRRLLLLQRSSGA
jgi:hypothetical protein